MTLMTTASLPVQLDGEPWRQKPCNMEISLGERSDHALKQLTRIIVIIIIEGIILIIAKMRMTIVLLLSLLQ